MRKKRNFWTKENCKLEALKYQSRSEFKFNAPSAYSKARKCDYLDEICLHMIKLGNIKFRCIYAYEFSDNYVYVGLTCNPKHRKIWRKNNIKDAVTKHMIETNLIPKYIELTNFVDINEATNLEEFYLNKYKNNGWNVLNVAKTGSIGGNNLFWTKDRCKIEALKYNTKNEFRLNCGGAYNSSIRNNWIEDITTHMKRPKRKIVWTFDACKNEALKYLTKKDFASNSSVAYSTSIKNKWINDICKHMHKLPYNTIQWTKEKCLLAANTCKSKTEFAKKYGGAYYRARQMGWLNEIFNK